MNCSFFVESSPCGSFKENSTIVPLLQCNEDMTSHLISPGTSLKRGCQSKTAIDEWRLILNRSGYVGHDAESSRSITICPKHRRDFTFDWPGRKSITCSHRCHKGRRKQLRTVRRVNLQMSEEIFNRYQVSVPIGSGKYVIMIMETILYKKHGTILYTGSIGGGRCVLLGGGGLT